MADQSPSQLPMKQPGEFLAASHVNALTKGVQLMGKMPLRGNGVTAFRNSLGVGSISRNFRAEEVEIVTDLGEGNPEHEFYQLYEVSIRYYKASDRAWVTDKGQGKYLFDARAQDEVYAVEDKVTVYWHDQRAAFIPFREPRHLVIGVLNGTLSYGSTAPMIVYEGDHGSETSTDETLTVGEWCLASNESLANGTRVTCGRINKKWYVLTYDICPTTS